MKLKKVLAAVAACAFLALSMCALTACADNSKEVITESLEQELDSLKNPDAATMSTLSANLPSSTLAQMGLTPDEVIKSLLAGFDGTVDSVEVNGNNAEAVVTISCKAFSQIESSMEEVTNSITDDPSQFEGMSVNEISTWAGQQIMDKLNELPIVTHDPITINYVLNGNTWEPASGEEEKLTSVLLG